MTEDQIADAVNQMRSHCRLLEEGHKAGVREYEFVSARSVLYVLGYTEEDADQVIRAIADAGFDYCLDHTVECSNGTGDGGREFPSEQVCYWGMDQLRSRLDCVDIGSRF